VPPERLTLAVVACLVGLAASLIVSYTRARAEGLGLTAKVALAACRAGAAAGRSDAVFRGRNHGSLLFWIVVVLALATSVTVVQRVLYVARAAGEPSVRRPSRQRDTLRPRARAYNLGKDRNSGGRSRSGHRARQRKLGVMLVGLGAVSTTSSRASRTCGGAGGLPIGSLSQMGTIRLGKRTEKAQS